MTHVKTRKQYTNSTQIDIIEGVNDASINKMTLHTSTTCKVSGLGQSSPQVRTNCALDTAGPLGCDVNDVRPNSFGKNFKAIKGPRSTGGGGYYIMEWDSSAIRTWFFPRDKTLPQTLTSDLPDTSQFGPPAANFQGDCDMDEVSRPALHLYVPILQLLHTFSTHTIQSRITSAASGRGMCSGRRRGRRVRCRRMIGARC